MPADIDALVDGDWVYVGGATEEMVDDGTIPGGVRDIIGEMRASAYRYRKGNDVVKRCEFDPPEKGDKLPP